MAETPEFLAAAETMRNDASIKLDSSAKLELYALYKQACMCSRDEGKKVYESGFQCGDVCVWAFVSLNHAYKVRLPSHFQSFSFHKQSRQGCEGECRSSRPGMLDFVNRAKW